MGVLARVRARMRRERPSAPLRALRRAGGAVDALTADVEQRRVEATLAGLTPWTVDRSVQLEALCGWCAFVLQRLGDATLDAHEARHRGGFVSEQTSQQVTAYYREAQEWVRRGREAATTPGYRIDVRLPADVPAAAGAWRERPPAHLEGMRAAVDTVGVHAEAATRDLLAHPEAATTPGVAETLGRLLARARAAAESVDGMWSSDLPGGLRGDLERELRAALTAYHHAGQLAALPELIATSKV